MKNLTEYTKETILSIATHAIDKLNDGIGIDTYGCDLHNELFNTDYFIVYHSRAVQWLKECNIDTFEAIEKVFEYEKDNFGEVNTEVNTEAIVNMYAYIVGEKVLNECETLSKKWDVRLTKSDCKKIIKELKSLINF